MSQGSVVISPLSESDTADYGVLFKYVFSKSPWHETWTIEEIKENLEKVRSRRGFLGKVAKIESRSVGFLTGYDIPVVSKIFYLDQLFIDETYHGRGIGKTLLSTTLETLRLKGGRLVILLTKVDSPAYFFYRHQGFKPLLPMFRLRGKVLLFFSVYKK